MGRLNLIKGPDLLLDAFCSLKDGLRDHHLVFAGPDEGMLPLLKQTASRHQVENRVHFTGYLGGDEKSDAYHAADLLVIPSRQEAMSIVVLESGVSGTPVVITEHCGFNEIGGVAGGKVVPATVEGICRGLREMLESGAGLKLMGENLRRYTLENFTWDAIINRYLEMYRNILLKRRREVNK
jgi:glycosyltransferase involved in cell wall biosynthesis